MHKQFAIKSVSGAPDPYQYNVHYSQLGGGCIDSQVMVHAKNVWLCPWMVPQCTIYIYLFRAFQDSGKIIFWNSFSRIVLENLQIWKNGHQIRNAPIFPHFLIYNTPYFVIFFSPNTAENKYSHGQLYQIGSSSWQTNARFGMPWFFRFFWVGNWLCKQTGTKGHVTPVIAAR